MWQYNDYLAISEDFIPVFSEDVDKSHKENWKFFIPHDHMRNLLEKLVVALERTHGGNKRSIWLTGAYGTGKTFASFVIKHLLEDPLDEIEDYFQKHQILMPLWPRFKALRENNHYLVVYRSATGHITSNRRFLIEVQQAIKEQLKAQGYTNAFGESIMDQLINKLTDGNGIFNWDGVFNKYRGRFKTVASAEEVIERLRAGDVKIGEQVANVLEEEGLALVDSPADVKAWIKEVISANNLQGIVFIWDEFTEFFINNVPVTPLQELAQATADMPFYLFLVTHRALNQFTRIDDDTRRKLLDRFHNCQLEMQPVTAYKLIGNVIEAKPDRHDEWEVKRDSLWSNVDVAVLQINVNVTKGERVEKYELKKLAPIHPFTAYLLATISSLYSSSQRTLFQFLKTDEPGSFQWFIANYPKDNWYWLTPDYLWQYFFEDARIETIEMVSDIISHYHSVKDNLTNEEELRVFRVMLLLTALYRQTQGANNLLKPNLSVIKRMFVGTELYNRINEVADNLCSRGIMLAVPSSGSDFEYIIPTTTIDQTKLQEYKQRAEASLTFEKMIDVEKTDAEFAADLKELLFLQGAAKLRHPIQIVSARELKLRGERIVKGVEKPYEIGVIMVVAQEDEHMNNSDEIAIELSKIYTNYCIIISQIAFGKKRWHEWLDYKARAWYHEEMKDNSTNKYYVTKSNNLVNEWIGEVRRGRIRAFFRGKQEELVGCDAVTGYLEDIVALVYPYGPEKLGKVATLYTSSWGKAGAEIGLKVAQNIQRPYKDVVNEMKNQGIWDDGGLDRNNNHPLAKMKCVVDEFFERQDHVSLKQLWEALQEPPYGLMPSPIGILLFSFLLRDYAQGYYYSDNVNSLPLNPNKLAELIEHVMKGARQSENYTIRKISTQGELFCDMVRNVFHLTDDQTVYPEEARKNMREVVKKMGYPLWTLIYYVQKTTGSSVAQDMAQATETLSGILAYDRDELSDQEMKEAFDAVHPVRHELPKLLSRDRMQEGMKQFLNINTPRIISLMKSLNLDISQIMERLRALLEEEVYLWREERVKEKLSEIICDLDTVDALNSLCGIIKQNLDEFRNYFRITWFKSKLPLICYKEGQSAEVANLIDYLNELIYHPGKIIKDNRSEDIRRFSSKLVSLLNDSTSLTVILVKKYTGHELNEQEAKELYKALPNLSNATDDEIKRAIIDTLSQQNKQKKIADIRQRWQALTGSESPESWSESMRTPIQWVLEGQIHQTFFAQYSNIYQLSEDKIDEMLDYLTNNVTELAVLSDRQYVLDKFIQVAAGDYADLVRKTGMVDELRDYVYDVLKGNVYQWNMRLNEVNRLVRQWINKNYRTSTYPQILKVIEAMSPVEIKQFVEQLVAEDALVGARLLAVVQRKNKQS